MSGQKWTPGPWNTRNHGVIVGGPFHQFERGTAQRQIAMACVIVDCEQAEAERDANARLISAAPDMAEALALLVQYDETPNGDGVLMMMRYADAITAARAALAKAGVA